MVREYGGDHIDLRDLEVHGDLIGKVEHHHHHPRAPDPPDTSPLGTALDDLTPADAHTFEVHEVADPTGGDGLPPLPPYLYRSDVDDPLRAAVREAGHTSGLVLLVGGSSVGKTRACWEAVHAELPGHWRLWHPLSPTRPEALKKALRANRIAPHTVVWLNEAQLYLRDPQVVEALQGLLSDASQGPVLVLGSLWPEYWRDLLDERSATRENRLLLDRARDVTVPDSFTPAELRANSELSRTDARLLWALTEGDRGQVTQALSGALDLVRRYRHGTPAERAVLEAAMDAARLQEFSHALPSELLSDAAPGYLSPAERAALPDRWFTTTIDSLTRRGPGTPGPLIPVESGRRPRYALPDYLEEYGRERRRHLCPPDGFWEALSGSAGKHVARLPPFAQAAEDRLLLQHADAILRRDTFKLIVAGRAEVIERRARLRTRTGDHATAERLATDAALSGRPEALLELVDAVGRPELTCAAFSLLRRTEGTDRCVDEAVLRIHGSTPENRDTLVRAVEESTGTDGLRAMIALLRPLRDRAGIRLCEERIGPRDGETSEAEQTRWESDWDRRVDQAVADARAGDEGPLLALLTDDAHPLHSVIRAEIARRCVSAGVHRPVLEFLVPRRGPSSPRTFDGWPQHPELLEVLADVTDPECLSTVASTAVSAEAWETGGRFLELAVGAHAGRSDVAVSMRELALSGRTHEVARLLEGIDDRWARELSLRLHLRHGDHAGAERLAFPDPVPDDDVYDTESLQRLLIRCLRMRGEVTAAEDMARRSVELGRYALAVPALAELLTARGHRAEAVALLAAEQFREDLDEIVGCLLTEPEAAKAAERMRRPEASGWNGPLLSLLAWAARAAGDHGRARELWPREGALVDEDLLRYLDRLVVDTLHTEGRGGRASRRETRALVRHLRHGSPLTLARDLASRIDTVPGLTRAERWTADRPQRKALTARIRPRSRYEGHRHLGVLLAWISHLYRNNGDRAGADELEGLALRVGGSAAVPALVRGHLAGEDHARVRTLLVFLGREITDTDDACGRSEPAPGEEESLRHAQQRAYDLDSRRDAGRALLHLAHAGALHLADDAIEHLAPTSKRFGDTRFLGAQISPVELLTDSARPDLALAVAHWLRDHRCHVDLSSLARDLELEGDWDNAALFGDLSRGLSRDPGRLARAREEAGADPTPDDSVPTAALGDRVRRAEERGDHTRAERLARIATAAGHGSVLEDLARRRVSRGDDRSWHTVLRRGLTPDGEPAPAWCEATRARGDLRPMIVDRPPMDFVTSDRSDGRIKVSRVHAPYVSPQNYLLLPFVLLLFTPAQSGAAVLGAIALSFAVALGLLPWLTGDARRRWPLRPPRLASLAARAALWGPALVGLHALAVAERRSPARAVVTVLTAPLSLVTASGFAVFSPWLGPLGGAALSLCLVYAFLAWAYRSRRRGHLRYLAALRSED